MAKPMFCVVFLLVAAAVTVEAGASPAPAHGSGLIKKSATFSLKLILHNLAQRSVTFKLEKSEQNAVQEVVAQKQQWTAIGPFTVNHKNLVLKLTVTVKNYKGEAVKKTLVIDLVKRFRYSQMQGKQTMAIEAVESWSLKTGMVFLIRINRVAELTFKL